MNIAEFLPGQITFRLGNRNDYNQLARFHYRPGHPATFAAICAADYHPPAHPLRPQSPTPIAVAVLSYPVPRMRGREVFFPHLAHSTYREKILFANQNLRTISRVIVHPQFRGVGLASDLVRCILKHCATRHVEAIAAMGAVHPFFEKAGMRRVQVQGDPKAYFIFDWQSDL